MVPSGASTGKFEAVELRDGEKGNYGGLSVHRAVENVNTRLAEAILGENALNQRFIDHKIIETDGTDNKNSVGANAALGVSMAVARAAAAAPVVEVAATVSAVPIAATIANVLPVTTKTSPLLIVFP